MRPVYVEGNPSLATVMKVMAALGIKLHVEVVPVSLLSPTALVEG